MTGILKINSEHDYDRKELPQIDQADLGKFIKYLKLKNIHVAEEKMNIDKLKPIQNEINKSKVSQLSQRIHEIKDKPLVVDQDYYIVDGHHRWLALKASNEKFVNAIIVGLPTEELLDTMNNFSKSYNKDIDEGINLVGILLQLEGF